MIPAGACTCSGQTCCAAAKIESQLDSVGARRSKASRGQFLAPPPPLPPKGVVEDADEDDDDEEEEEEAEPAPMRGGRPALTRWRSAFQAAEVKVAWQWAAQELQVDEGLSQT